MGRGKIIDLAVGMTAEVMKNGADRKASDRGRFSAPRHGDVTLAGHVRARTESWHSGTEKTKSQTGGKESRRWRRVHKTTRR